MKVCPNCQTTLLVRTGIQTVPVEITTYINTNPTSAQKTTYCTHCAEGLIAAVPFTSIESAQRDLDAKRSQLERHQQQHGSAAPLRPNRPDGPASTSINEWLERQQAPMKEELRVAENHYKAIEAIINKEKEAKIAIQNQLTPFKSRVATQKKDVENQIQEHATWFVLLTTATPATWGHQVITTVDTICHAPFDDKLNLAIQCIQLGGNALVDAKWLTYQGKAGNYSMMMATAIKVIPTATFKLDDRSVKAATELKRLYEL